MTMEERMREYTPIRVKGILAIHIHGLNQERRGRRGGAKVG